MNEKAEILLESLPNIPYRQWVFTVLRKLRYIMAYDHSIQSALLKIIIKSIKDYINSISKMILKQEVYALFSALDLDLI